MPLADAFWNWAVLGGVAINALSSLVFFALLANDEAIAALLVGHFLSVPYNIVAAVGVWRSAARYQGDRRWASAARIVTAIGMTILSVT